MDGILAFCMPYFVYTSYFVTAPIGSFDIISL